MKKKINFISDQLNKYGYCIIENILNKKECFDYLDSIEKLRKLLNKNKYHEDELTNFGQVIIRDLVLRDPKTFLKLIDKKIVNQTLKKIFNDKFILDNCMASNSIKEIENYKSLAHIDSHLATTQTINTSDIVVLFCLDNFTKENGCTKIWPGSHLTGIRIQNEKQNLIKKKKFKYVEAKRGSIVFFLGQTWHQIGQNKNNLSRWGVLCHYKRWWIKPSTDFTKCGPKIFKMLNNHQKELFGFNSISPKFNFKKKIRNLKTLRKVENLSKDYLKVLTY